MDLIHADLAALEMKVAATGAKPDVTGSLALDYGQTATGRIRGLPQIQTPPVSPIWHHKLSCGHEYASREIHADMLCTVCGSRKNVVFRSNS